MWDGPQPPQLCDKRMVLFFSGLLADEADAWAFGLGISQRLGNLNPTSGQQSEFGG